MKSAQTATSNWMTGMQLGGAKWLAGINAYTGNPMALAAQQAPKAMANYSKVLSNGSWAAKLNSTPVATWKQGASMGQAKFASGAAKGQIKYQAYATAFAPVWQQMAQASQSAGGGQAGMNAAYQIQVAAGRKGSGTSGA